MNAAARVTLTALIDAGSVEPIPVDANVVENLLRQAGNHVRTAQAGLDGGDPEGGFQLAYDACRKLCLALLLATGHRPKDEAGHHRVTFEGAAALAQSFSKRKVVDEASDLRFVRNNTEYRAEAVTAADAADAIEIATELADAVTGPIAALLTNAAKSP